MFAGSVIDLYADPNIAAYCLRSRKRYVGFAADDAAKAKLAEVLDQTAVEEMTNCLGSWCYRASFAEKIHAIKAEASKDAKDDGDEWDCARGEDGEDDEALQSGAEDEFGEESEITDDPVPNDEEGAGSSGAGSGVGKKKQGGKTGKPSKKPGGKPGKDGKRPKADNAKSDKKNDKKNDTKSDKKNDKKGSAESKKGDTSGKRKASDKGDKGKQSNKGEKSSSGKKPQAKPEPKTSSKGPKRAKK